MKFPNFSKAVGISKYGNLTAKKIYPEAFDSIFQLCIECSCFDEFFNYYFIFHLHRWGLSEDERAIYERNYSSIRCSYIHVGLSHDLFLLYKVIC